VLAGMRQHHARERQSQDRLPHAGVGAQDIGPRPCAGHREIRVYGDS
jgi:hypothetical protein